ncbi:hypothetical protein, conserved [Eimeria tenella]|uniref:Uncharacterized protein n=1 Tax=Eimeria tenella TaxID=5802 RepID=U6L2F9_EIMTE|nr:hypothetical protein, conserved [Eimeria tenella]CDJ42799.1 hypothetical protein, conserved [Eimeria tenella]|eukprot:XP_013233549.1 hypothetical protein, conserved [Eimeria tenella]
MQLPTVGLHGANSNAKLSKKGPRSISLSELAADESQGHLLLPITVPFNQQVQSPQEQPQQQEVKEEGGFKMLHSSNQHQQQDELQGIDTAASTPNHLGRTEPTDRQAETKEEKPQRRVMVDNSNESPAALLLKNHFANTGSGQWLEEDSRPEFIHLCFPGLLPPLDISAMQAQELQQSESKPGQQATKEQKQVKTGSSSLRNTPAPLHALPSGRIGQLLIRRSGRVHLRLLTEVATEKKEEAVFEASEATDTSQKKAVALRPAYKLRSEDICYDVLVGTEGSFAQVRAW